LFSIPESSYSTIYTAFFLNLFYTLPSLVLAFFLNLFYTLPSLVLAFFLNLFYTVPSLVLFAENLVVRL